jgi:hypothetical protein
MSKLFLFLLFLFVSYAAAADGCVSRTKDVPKEWTYVGKENMVFDGKIFEVDVHRKIQSDSTFEGEKFVTFSKRSEDDAIFIDSMVYSDGTYKIFGTADFFPIHIEWERSRSGVVQYIVSKDKGMALETIDIYIIGLKKEEVYDANGKLNPRYREVRGDTVFQNLNYREYGGHVFTVIEIE